MEFKHKYKYRHMQVSIEDDSFEDIYRHFISCFKFIDEDFDRGKNVLIHCMAGVSRSATIVIGYLMYKRGLLFEESYAFVK